MKTRTIHVKDAFAAVLEASRLCSSVKLLEACMWCSTVKLMEASMVVRFDLGVPFIIILILKIGIKTPSPFSKTFPEHLAAPAFKKTETLNALEF